MSLPPSTIKELEDLKLMAKAVIETVDRLIVEKEKPKKKVDGGFERYKIHRRKVMLNKKAAL